MIDSDTVVWSPNSLCQYVKVDGETFDYDNNGNLTDDGVYDYTYDCENRLTLVKEGASTIATYKYDFAGRRIRKIVDSTTTKFVYDGARVIAEYEGDTLVRKYVYGPGIDEPVCMIDVDGETETRYYYHYDGLGVFENEMFYVN